MPLSDSGSFLIGGDLPVTRLGFGAMRLCGPGVWGFPADRAGALEVLRHAVALGVNFIDTADAYGPDVNEYQVAEALRPYPPGLLVATKGGLVRSGPNLWERDGRPEHLQRALNNSLRRLGVDTIDLYQLHAPDERVRFEDSVGVLARAREDGRIRHVGLSNVSVAQLETARAIVPIATVQNRYNLSFRQGEDVLDRCTALGIGFIPWYPLAAAGLSRADSGALAEIARAHDATPSQVALAWLLQKSPVMLPIPGTSSLAHLAENCAAASLRLSAEEVARLEAMGG